MGHIRTSADVSVRPDEAIVLLRVMPLLQQLTEDTLKKISEAVQPVRYGPGESVVRLNREGAGLYIIWNGEAKVVSPPNPYPSAHKESLLKRGDYFGLMGPVKRKFRVDVMAINEVVCLVLGREYADLLATTSLWDWDAFHNGPSVMEELMQLETVGAVEDMKMTSPGFPNFLSPFQRATKRVSGPVVISPNYFGGQLVCQALLAATKTVNSELLVHSLHSYFLQTSNVNFSIVYEVEVIRDGRTFATRHVKAKQDGKLVFVLYASFKREEKGLEYVDPMPPVPAPEEVASLEQVFDEYFTDPRVPLDYKKDNAGLKFPLLPMDVRDVNPLDKFQPAKVETGRKQLWMRTRSKILAEQSIHRCVAAYATDILFLETSQRPHPQTYRASMQILSLDHTMWFHESFNANEWLLFVMESPVSADGRGLVWGKLYTQDGKLVMTVAQEGLIRTMEDESLRLSKL